MTDMHRGTDEAQAGAQVPERQFITIDRRIPLTWLFGTLAALGAALGGMFLQQLVTGNKVDAANEKVTAVASDVRQIKSDLAGQSTKSLEDNFTLRDLNRRLTATEAQVQTLMQATKR